MKEIIIIIIVIILVTLFSTIFGEPNTAVAPITHTTFSNISNYRYSTLIEGELTLTHVQEAETIVGTITAVQIGTEVTTIGTTSDTIDEAPFYNQRPLLNLSFNNDRNSQPSQITTIGNFAFGGCTGLTSVTFPKSIETIGDFAFDDCPFDEVVFDNDGEIQIISVSSNSFTSPDSLVYDSITGSLTVSADGDTFTPTNISEQYTTFIGSLYSVLITGELTLAHVQAAEAVIGTIRGVDIGTAVTKIGSVGDNAGSAPFVAQTSLTKLSFKGTTACKTFGSYCFSGCTSLISFDIPSVISTIANNCFGSCSSLTSLTIPSGSTTIGISAFRQCTGLNSLTIPDSIQIIDNTAFIGCTSLTTLTLPNSITEVNAGTFDSCPFTSVVFEGTGVSRDIIVKADAFTEPASVVSASEGGTINIGATGNTYT